MSSLWKVWTGLRMRGEIILTYIPGVCHWRGSIWLQVHTCHLWMELHAFWEVRLDCWLDLWGLGNLGVLQGEWAEQAEQQEECLSLGVFPTGPVFLLGCSTWWPRPGEPTSLWLKPEEEKRVACHIPRDLRTFTELCVDDSLAPVRAVIDLAVNVLMSTSFLFVFLPWFIVLSELTAICHCKPRCVLRSLFLGTCGTCLYVCPVMWSHTSLVSSLA